MATGIPRTKWQTPQDTSGGNGSDGSSTDVHIDYEGKKSREEILKTPPAVCRQLWPKHYDQPAANQLYYGDNLGILAALARNPAVCGQVRLIYIDPPYATKSVFQSRKQNDAYTDLREGAHYLEFLRERLIFLREILAEDGSIYVHLDDNMAFLVKAVMDEVFGRANFRNWITRKKCNPKNYTRKVYGNIADFILFYTKGESYVWHRPVDPWTDEKAAKEYQYLESGTGRSYKKVPVHAPGVRHGETGRLWRGKQPPPGKHWQYPPRCSTRWMRGVKSIGLPPAIPAEKFFWIKALASRCRTSGWIFEMRTIRISQCPVTPPKRIRTCWRGLSRHPAMRATWSWIVSPAPARR